ncbi:bifunctional 2-polyprenyl-6-hydroxyphenol methylase/3-demethylubiquinol 3-O-methyltransferase UbiG [Haloarchaeobius sp. HME9146]|uniref:class I SAM-dependent methyltransferase n=1 Tax=Haloarchaeobius sp. HME9146 TaxID=2978732 RepID=UPI0021BE98BB|nr:class I SAM-dependent methyltransferase [Haloarchaeobius sp. HME9146]MCT9095506.1 class I SAM-dependent methyltransferase [Haloarchaeobius sp. HME9146]
MTHWTEEMFVDHPEVFAVTMRQRVDDAAEQVEQLLALVGEHGVVPETALDVACGIGRHAVELADAGVSVRGVDISPHYVETARERAADADVADRATFEVGDMRDLGTVEGEYDLVTNMWTAFGYFDEDTNEAVAAGLHETVADDGVLVMELVNKEATMANYRNSFAGRDDDLLHVEETEYTPATGRMETTLTLFEEQAEGYDHVGEVSWDLRLYAPSELRRLLERAGFSEVSLYGGLDGSDLERETHRLVVVAEP